MQTWDAITSRRNVREYAQRPIASADLDRILEAGRRSPSSRNTQPWDFVAVTEREQLTELATVWQGAGHVATSAATIALIASIPDGDRQRNSVYYDLGQVTMSMMVTAADLGIGSGHSAVGDQDRARELLGFPADRLCTYLIAFGYPAARPLTPILNPDRRPFDDVIHRGHW